MNDQKKPELLSPAGSMESLLAAVNNGCDAVYLGGKNFSARQYAGNFSLEELNKACDYCHLRNVKLYVTVNTVYKENEMDALMRFVGQLYEMGVDALIIQDIGAAARIRQTFPDFPLHASTQLAANSLEDVLFLEEMGFQKIVLSRELNIEEIEHIASHTKAEIETFVHGALCVCYSGQCIMSSMLGGRSGNRGRCAQTCRLPYTLLDENKKEVQEGYLLSPKDMQALTILPQLIKAGIASFKIEGRMKSPEYVAGVTGIYRKYMDRYFENSQEYAVEEQDMKVLLQLFNRGGFSEGYYHTHSGSSMMSILRPKTWGLQIGYVDSYQPKANRVVIRTREALVPGDGIEIWTETGPHCGSNINKASKPGDFITVYTQGDIRVNNPVYKTHDKALEDALGKTWEKDTRKREISGIAHFQIGKAARLELFDEQGHKVAVEGDIVQKAENQPLSQEKIVQQLSKMGTTVFHMKDLRITGDESVYLPIASLNELRRNGAQKLEEQIVFHSKRSYHAMSTLPSSLAPVQRQKKLTVLVGNQSQFDIAVTYPLVDKIYLECTRAFSDCLEECIRKAAKEKKKIYAALPRIDRAYIMDIYHDYLCKLKESDIDGFLIRSPGEYYALLNGEQDSKKEYILDYNLNIFNRSAVQFWFQKGISQICMSPELNLTEICQIADENCEMLGYGYLPLMTTHQCPVGAYVGGKESGMFCAKKGNAQTYYLQDRKGVLFPLQTNCEACVCTVLNSKPLFTLKFFREIVESPTGFLRLMFTNESEKEMKNILTAYSQMTLHWNEPSIDADVLIDEMAKQGSTKGHYFRGIE